ncbi:hypothetical protein MNBD_ALPHA07-1387 [hydrothermal vent metagenome]|uniref:Uncharacterized protein n=1 Tax=hydrothermal vent metagenome TaxID=652676 RepID=A0A3B0RHI5_9ZZZZ
MKTGTFALVSMVGLHNASLQDAIAGSCQA